ncbi:hypothetical protein [Haliscomenobacter sp.]|uniref:hypothetical protein n=1 Tax=Haliscomenobacter sp. TaxID=2717303 RepID=UPI0033651E29
MQYALLPLFFALSLSLMAQGKQMVINNKKFNSVFSNLKTGIFNGTANGVLFIKNTELQEVILDFQGSKAHLNIKADVEEVYDVSTKTYQASTTSGKTSIEYNTYNYGNELIIKLARDTFQVGLLDGASDAIIDGLNYFYKAEKGTEYLIFKTEKVLILSNYRTLINGMKRNGDTIDTIKPKEKFIQLLPNSVLVFAIGRSNN